MQHTTSIQWNEVRWVAEWGSEFWVCSAHGRKAPWISTHEVLRKLPISWLTQLVRLTETLGSLLTSSKASKLLQTLKLHSCTTAHFITHYCISLGIPKCWSMWLKIICAVSKAVSKTGKEMRKHKNLPMMTRKVVLSWDSRRSVKKLTQGGYDKVKLNLVETNDYQAWQGSGV